jgi:aryl-alcohol dehydrogenase-like predicted oxidoreductase
MSDRHADRRLTRRDFLRRAAASAAAAGSGLVLPASDVLAAAPATTPGMRHRVLGRTKLSVSELGLGTIKINASVALRALDLGVNYFDTAECYQNGKSEEKLGKALKGRRDEAIVATKWHTDGRTPAADLLKSLDASLQRLAMDHVDLIQIHGANRPAQVTSDELWEAFLAARKAGKARFNGVSTHANQVAVVRAAVESGRYDAVLPSYNAMIGARVGQAVAGAHKAGLGTVIMKALQPAHEGKAQDAFANLEGNPYQRAIQWCLRDPNVSTVIVDMPTFQQLEENIGAVTSSMTKAEQAEFERAVAKASPGACRLCGSCTGQCPRGVQVADVVRCSLYNDGYGDRSRAVDLYRALPASVNAARCADCAECAVVCPWGVPVRSRMESAHVRFA